MTSRWLRRCVLLLFCVLGSLAFAIDVPIKYCLHKGETEEFQPYGGREFNKMTSCPEGKWKLPELKSKQPVYAWVELGEKKRLLILDCKSPNSAFYDLIYFDNNGNSDLTDEKAWEGQAVGQAQFYNGNFPALDTAIQIGNSSLPYRFSVQCYYYAPDPRVTRNVIKDGLPAEEFQGNLRFRLSAQCYYAGDFTLEGKRYKFMLGDSNGNGRFNDRADPMTSGDPNAEFQTFYGNCDDLYLTGYGDKFDYTDQVDLGDLMHLDGKVFRVSISTPDAKTILAPTTDTLISVKLSQPTKQLTIYTEDKSHCLMAYGADKEIKVPAGKYHLLAYRLLKKDPEGDTWRLGANSTTLSPWVNADGKSEALIPFGEPITPVVRIPDWSRQQVESGTGKMVNLELELTGVGKEIVNDLTRVSGSRTKIRLSSAMGRNNMPKEPTFKIVKTDGEVVASGSFEYG